MRALYGDAIKNNRQKPDEGKLGHEMSEIGIRWENHSVEHKILSPLPFRYMNDRQSTIPLAHQRTLTWLFSTLDTRKRSRPSTSFVKWLLSDGKIYWITGAPGSGKSTLMNFISVQPLTSKYLRTWANSEVIIAKYFFWDAAKVGLQKFQEGMLRSLLYQTFRQRPDHIRHVFPHAWHTRHASEESTSRNISLLMDSEVASDIWGLMNAMRLACTVLARCKRTAVLLH